MVGYIIRFPDADVNTAENTASKLVEYIEDKNCPDVIRMKKMPPVLMCDISEHMANHIRNNDAFKAASLEKRK